MMWRCTREGDQSMKEEDPSTAGRAGDAPSETLTRLRVSLAHTHWTRPLIHHDHLMVHCLYFHMFSQAFPCPLLSHRALTISISTPLFSCALCLCEVKIMMWTSLNFIVLLPGLLTVAATSIMSILLSTHDTHVCHLQVSSYVHCSVTVYGCCTDETTDQVSCY